MVDVAARRVVSAQEYLAFERAAASMHEHAAGEMFAMAGASPRHDALVANLVVLIGHALAGGPRWTRRIAACSSCRPDGGD